MSPKGSIATVCSAPLRRKADCPYHSICMLLLRSGQVQGLAVVEDAAAQRRGRGGHEAGDDRERERGVQAVPERLRDQLREEVLPGEHGAVVQRDRVQRVRAHEALDRVVAEKGGEQDRDRRSAATLPAVAASIPCASKPLAIVCGS